MDGAAVIAAYHELWQVEASFRMTKSDLRARPVFHHERDAIEAHLTVVFAALAVSRYLQNLSGVSIKKLVQTLRAARSATIDINGQHLTLDPELTPAARALLRRLQEGHGRAVARVRPGGRAPRTWRRSAAARPGRRRPAATASQSGKGGGASPASSRTRSESSLLTGSMIRATTRSRNTASPPAAPQKPSTS